MTPEERFWSFVRVGPEQDCWPWQGGKREKGYGYFYDGRKIHGRTSWTAHRIAFALATGDASYLPDRKRVVMHSCNNPPCCNPSHLSVGSIGQNSRDAYRDGLTPRPPFSQGETHYCARFTADEVRSIRSKLDAGQSAKSLAKAYGVSHMAIRKIRDRKSWKCVF